MFQRWGKLMPMEKKGIFYFDPDDSIYQDHFPGNPVVPGSVIINAFLTAGKEAGFFQDPYVIRAFRFKGFVSPGEYAFRIQLTKDQWECRLYQDTAGASNTLATGKITR